jgi:hypothetical protein
MRPLLRVVCALSIAATASGQGVTVRGVVYDSLHSRPLGGAFVVVGSKTTMSDSTGRFSIDDVAPGNHRVTAQHDAIDLLGISAIGTIARVTDGKDLVTVSLPSFRTMWRQLCGLTPPAIDTGFVFGTVRAARNATVTASWIDIVAVGTKVSQKAKIMEVTSDSIGNFALCGVPTTTGLTIRAVADSLESETVDIAPMDKERVVRHDIILATPGRASISGKVLADSGRGVIANADLSITDLRISTTTNDRGEYSLTALRPGSHRLNIRKIGYGEVDIPIQIQDGDHSVPDIVMSRVTILDSVKVKATVLARDEGMRTFEENRKLGLGTFVTQADLDKANGRSLSQMMVMFPSLTIGIDPRTGKYKASMIGRGPKSIGPSRGGGAAATSCPLVFVDGVMDRDYDLNEFPPSAVAGIEYYKGAAQVPAEYARMGSVCGVIAIHLRK